MLIVLHEQTYSRISLNPSEIIADNISTTLTELWFATPSG